MAYELTVAVFPEYVRVTVVGEALPNPTGVIEDVYRAWEAGGRPRLLVDTTRYREHATITRDYYYVQAAADIGHHRIQRTACLDAQETRDTKDTFETMARNRGITVRFFYGPEQEAVDWLIGAADPER